MLRSQEHTNTLVEKLELGTLWDEYGLVGDIVVHRVIIYYVFALSNLYF